MRNFLGILVVLAVLVLLGGCLFFSQYTGLVAMNEVVNQNWADLEARLLSRDGLIPDLVSAVKDRAGAEEDVLAAVADARAKLAAAATSEAKAEADAALTASLDRLLAVASGSPELAADETFIRLRNELDDAGKRIEAAGRSYNDNVEIYNMCLDGFLVSFIAPSIGYLPRERFEPPKVPLELRSALASDEVPGPTAGTDKE